MTQRATLSSLLLRAFVINSLLFLSSHIPMHAQEDVFDQHKVDSLQNLIKDAEGEGKLDIYEKLVEHIMWTGESEFIEKVMLEYIDEAQSQKKYDYAGRGYAHFTSFISHADNARLKEIADKGLAFTKKHALWESYFFIHDVLIENNKSRNKSEAFNYVQDLYQEAKSVNSKLGEAIVARWLAYFVEDKSQSEQYLYEAIEILEKENDHSQLAITYERMANLLRSLKKFEELDKVMDKWATLLERGNSKDNHYLAYDMMKVSNARAMGDLEEAKKYAEKIKEYSYLLPVSAQMQFLFSQIELSFMENNYPAVIEDAETIAKLAKENGEEEVYLNALFLISEIHLLMQNYEQALLFLKDYHAGKDSITNAETKVQLNELRTVYEVDKLTAEKEIRRQQLIIAIGGCVLLIIIVVIYIIYSRRLRRKNLNLYNQVRELSKKEKAVEQCLLKRPDDTLSKELQLFKKVSEYMQSEKPFVSPDMNRKALADAVGSNEKYLADAIRIGSGSTFSEYIANLRLQYALDILNDQPGLTLDAVAADSGHGSYSQFFRSFSQKYGISPSEYRRLSSQSSVNV